MATFDQLPASSDGASILLKAADQEVVVQDNRLFETILGRQTPWRISRVALDTSGERVDLWAEHSDTRWPCPDCQQELPCH